LEAARAERMRQNGHGAIAFEDVRTWIEETGLCIFLPRSAQAGFTAPTFVEAIAGQRTTEPTLELIATAEQLLVRLEAEGVAVRLNLAGQPGDQPDYVVAGWVLPYIYALRGDRDWRRSPQLTGSRQVSQLAVQAAKQLDSANMTAAQIRDALGREVTETAVLRALHELWKQLRIIPVVPEVGHSALWQPLRQRFQKAIAEGASTSQVTAISVLASIYLQAVIAASMEDVELFLSPLTSRSKIREVVRGLAATRQVHSTTMGHSSMFYVAGTLPEFPAVPNYQISGSYPSYLSRYNGIREDDEPIDLDGQDITDEEGEKVLAHASGSDEDSVLAEPAYASAGQSSLRNSARPSSRPSGEWHRSPSASLGQRSSNAGFVNSNARSNGNFGDQGRFSKPSSFGNRAPSTDQSGSSSSGSPSDGDGPAPARSTWGARPSAERHNSVGNGSPVRNSASVATGRPSPRMESSNQAPRPRSAEDAPKRFPFSGQDNRAPRPRSFASRTSDNKPRG